MAFIAIDQNLGEVDLSAIDPVGPGMFAPAPLGLGPSTSGRSSYYMEELRGYDPNLGGGVFCYAQLGAGIYANAVVEFTPSFVNGRVIMTANLWAGTANTGRKLGVAMATGAAGQWGWFQVDGNAIAAVFGTATANTPAYWAGVGVMSSTPAASKQACGMTFATTGGVTLGQGNSTYALTNAQAVITLCRPEAQGAIT